MTWGARTLRTGEARREEPRGDAGRKLDAIRSAARHEFPTGNVETMLSEIEAGYGSGPA